MIIEVEGQQVEVDDSFAKLSPDQQQAELQHIVTALKPPESSAPVSEATQASMVNPLYSTLGGAVAGEVAGPMINKATEGYQASKAARLGTPPPAAAPTTAPGTTHTPYNPRGSSVEQSVDNWRTYADAQNEAAKKVRQESSLHKKYPGFTRAGPPPATVPTPPPSLGAKIGAAMPGPVKDLGAALGAATQSGVAPWLGRAVAGAGAGFQGADAYNRAQQGDVSGAAISGVGALGSAASLIPHPVTRIGGTAIGMGAEALNMYLDELKKKSQGTPQAPMGNPMGDQVPQMAAGGAVQHFQAGGLSALKKLFDPRFDKRVGEISKLHNQVRHVEPTHNFEAPKIYLPDYEGHPFVTSMSDRTDASGKLLGLNNNMFQNAVDLTGGQGYMFDPRNPGKVWESGKGPSSAILKSARAAKDFTGKEPIYLPWRMAPTGSDFSPMTGETMLAHAQTAMSSKERAGIDELLKNIIPNWQGIDHPESFKHFGSAPTAARKAAQKAMDKQFRNEGGLGLGEARLAISEPSQIAAPEGGLQNVGRIFTEKDLIKSGEGSRYPYGVPGEGLGTLDREINIAQLLPKWAQERGVQDVTRPHHTDMRSLQMKPYSGILTDKLLKDAGFKKGGVV